MWQESKGNYFNFVGDDLIGSIIHHDARDGVHPCTYGVQIHTSDGGLLAIGYIHEDDFDEDTAKSLCESAISMNMPFDWWIQNSHAWWRSNYGER